MTNLKKMFSAAFIVSAMVIGSMASSASAVDYFSPITGFEDNDIEFLVNQVGSSTIIDIGDRLVGVAEFDTSHSVPPGSSSPILPQELTAVFDLTVSGKSCVVIGPITSCTFTFTATNTTGVEGVLAGQPAGTAVTLWLDDTPNLDVINVNCVSLADCVAKASDGTVFLSGSLTNDPDAIWFAQGASDDITQVRALGATQTGGSYNFCLGVTTNNTGLTLLPQNCITGGQTLVIGGGAVKGGQGLPTFDGLFARSDNDFQIQPVSVPEPSSMLLLGAGLLGVGFITRRRNSK